MTYLLYAACLLAVFIAVLLARVLSTAIDLYRQELRLAREIAAMSKPKGAI